MTLLYALFQKLISNVTVYIYKLKVKRFKNIYHANINPKKAAVVPR